MTGPRRSLEIAPAFQVLPPSLAVAPECMRKWGSSAANPLNSWQKCVDGQSQQSIMRRLSGLRWGLGSVLLQFGSSNLCGRFRRVMVT